MYDVKDYSLASLWIDLNDFFKSVWGPDLELYCARHVASVFAKQKRPLDFQHISGPLNS